MKYTKETPNQKKKLNKTDVMKSRNMKITIGNH
jgi:hypothetical protein